MSEPAPPAQPQGGGDADRLSDYTCGCDITQFCTIHGNPMWPTTQTLVHPIKRPNWREVHAGSAHQYKANENDLIAVTRETLSHALSALRTINADDYYHTNGAAEAEIRAVLADSAPDAQGGKP